MITAEKIVTLSVICGAISTIAIFLYKSFIIIYKAYKRMEEISDNFIKVYEKIEKATTESKKEVLECVDELYKMQNEALRTLLRNAIMEKTDHILDKGKITKEETFALGKLYEVYKKLGGNSTVDLRVNNALNLKPDRGAYDYYFEEKEKE